MKFINNETLILLNTKKITTGKKEYHLYSLIDPENYDRITLLGEPDYDFAPKTQVRIEFSLREKDKAFAAFLTKMEEA